MNHTLHRQNPVADDQAALWAAKLDGSVLTADDRIALDHWIEANPAHRALLSSYCQFSADLEQQLPSITGIRDQAADAGTARATVQPSPWLRRSLLAGAALTAAAAVALTFWIRNASSQSQDFSTPAAHRQTLTLTDGTRVDLNAHTSLQVDISRSSRHVRLADGEAFFDVSRDPARPFIVETPHGSVRVLGTRFNVRTDDAAALEVTVADGSVQVRTGTPGASPVPLAAGDTLASTGNTPSVRALSDDELADVLAWRQGQIVFAGTPLKEAVARFARYHGRGITASPAAGELRVGGRFSLDDLDGFLSALEQVLNVRISRDLSGTIHVNARTGG